MQIELKRSIVRESIQSIVCIDDDYVQPYENRQAEVKSNKYSDRLAFSRKVYKGMALNNNCEVKIIPFRKDVSLNDLAAQIYCKDLLLLDWELTSPKNIIYPLQIIERAVSQKVKYICIYTNDKDTASITASVKDYYRYNKKSIDDIAHEATEKGVYKHDFYFIAEMVERGNREAGEIRKELQKTLDSLDIKLGSTSPLNNLEKWRLLYRKWNQMDFYPDTEIARAVNEYELNGEKIVRIDGTYIMLFNKVTVNKGIKEKDIIKKITNLLINEPNSVMNLIWNQYTRAIQERLNVGGEYFFDVNWKSFAYYAYRLSEGYSDREMKHFLSDVFMKKLTEAIVLNEDVLNPELAEELKTKGKKQKITRDSINDYIRLNAYLNINHELSTAKHKITFGDVLMGDGNDFYLCVSSKCSCAERNNPRTIKKDFFFVKGGYPDDELLSFEEVEKENYSFVSYKDKRQNEVFKMVKWKNTIINIHIDEPEVYKGLKVKGATSKPKEFTYICNIVDEYAQRMANSAYSYENRVGVSFANSYLGKTLESDDEN